jgi:hypothetical protein
MTMEHRLTDRRFAILKSAAARGPAYAYAGVSEDWQAGIARLVKAAQRDGETRESAFARVTASGEGAQVLECFRRAQDTESAQRRGRPRKYQPGEIKRSQIEKALSAAALDLATATGSSFESAFAKVLQTPAGSDLYTALRRAESEV